MAGKDKDVEITFAENFKKTVSDNAVHIEDYIMSEFIKFVNNLKGYTYIVDSKTTEE